MVVVLEREIFVFGVVCLVVFVVKIVQLDEINDADIFLMAGYVVDKMMEKCAHFHDSQHTLIAWRTGRQNLESQEYREVFFHWR